MSVALEKEAETILKQHFIFSAIKIKFIGILIQQPDTEHQLRVKHFCSIIFYVWF